MALEMEVKASKKIEEGKHSGKIEEGKHSGKIVDLKTREGISKKGEKYVYLDVIILEASGVELKAGYSAYITPQSKLGQLLTRFGAQLNPGDKIDVEAVLMDKLVTFLTQDRKTGDATYSDVLADTVKPLP